MTTTLTQEHASTLLDKLANDDAFREQLLGDPVSAMASIGVKVDPATVPAVRRLPSKAEASANTDALQARVQAKSGMAAFFLC